MRENRNSSEIDKKIFKANAKTSQKDQTSSEFELRQQLGATFQFRSLDVQMS